MDVEHKITLIRKHAGETFRTKKGEPFQYEVDGNTLRPSRTEYQVPLSDVRKALTLVPFDGPGVINQVIRGPSYIWAILHDQRISEGDW
jgi:hypothetical protein